LQTEDKARIARLEQLLDELQQENAQLKTDVEGLRVAIRTLVSEAFGVFDAIERQTEAGKMRMERTLGRPFTDMKLVDELFRDTATRALDG
jgi:hypothetical protein